MRRLIPALLLAACSSEYGLIDKPDETVEPDDTDPAGNLPPDTADETDEPMDSAAPSDDTPPASAPVYAHTASVLFTVEPATGATTRVGTFVDADGGPITDMVDIAIDLQGRLYGGTQGDGTTFDGRALWRIDPTTAEATKVCDLNVVMYALTFTSDGTLVAGGFSTLETIDVDNGCAVGLLFHDDDYDTSGDLVGLPDGKLYWTVRGPGSNDPDELVAIDPNNISNVEELGVLGTFDRLFGLGYDQTQERLYGFSADGVIVGIEPRPTSQPDPYTSQLNGDGTAWWGATTNPVIWQ